MTYKYVNRLIRVTLFWKDFQTYKVNGIQRNIFWIQNCSLRKYNSDNLHWYLERQVTPECLLMTGLNSPHCSQKILHFQSIIIFLETHQKFDHLAEELLDFFSVLTFCQSLEDFRHTRIALTFVPFDITGGFVWNLLINLRLFPS